jgi:folate-binding protein YgfZ
MTNQAVLIGYGPSKTQMVNHLSSRVLGQDVELQDITHLNDVFIGSGNSPPPPEATVHQSHFGTVYVIPKRVDWKETWTQEEWNEHRIEHVIPFHGHEITPKFHPLACGLGELVHSNKGCYLGQEVLTRMRSRGKQGYRLEVKENPVEQATTKGQKRSLCIVRDQ